VSSLRLTPALVASIVAALVSCWICFAIVANESRSSERPAVSVRQPDREAATAAGTAMMLSPVPALRVRSTLIAGTPVSPRVVPRRHRTRTRTATIDMAASPNPAPAMSTPVAPQETPAPAPAAPPAPPPRSAPTPAPTVTAAPKPAATPDFDQSQPSGFDTSG
jgi:2-oxoglutarate dehydrogenase E2 component (dihydrolipoamide succinyltransferase)